MRAGMLNQSGKEQFVSRDESFGDHLVQQVKRVAGVGILSRRSAS
jgi:hypothetical protein